MSLRQKLTATLAVILTTFAVVLASATVLAATVDPLKGACDRANRSPVCQNTTNENPVFGPKGLVTRATQIVTVIVGIAAVIMIIIGGFKYVTSSGDSSSVESAKNTILFAVIGLVIALVAQAIVLFILRKL